MRGESGGGRGTGGRAGAALTGALGSSEGGVPGLTRGLRGR